MKFLNDTKGIIHVGANKGNERVAYNNHKLNVLWFEPIPYIFNKLVNRTKDYIPAQKCLQILITDVDGKEYDFKISSNRGLSSSIFDMKLHKEIWKGIEMGNSIKIKSQTLNTIFKTENIDLYDSMVLDTQGSELLVLKGAGNIIEKMKYIMVEVADFEAYECCCKLPEIQEFMDNNGFKEFDRVVQTSKEKNNIGNYYDITYKRGK